MRRFIAALFLSLVCGYVAAAGNDWYESRDFHCLWAGARIVAHGGDPYDAITFENVVAQGRPDRTAAIARCDDRFAYPLWTATLLAPFGALPHPMAATLWIALLVMASAFGISWSWVVAGGSRAGWPILALLVVFSEPYWLALVEGQFGPLMLAMVAGIALALERRRDIHAGIALAALAVKPQLSLLSAPVLLGRAAITRRDRVVAAAMVAGGAAALITLSLDSSWPRAWFAAASAKRAGVATLATIWDVAAHLGSPIVAISLAAALLALMIALLHGQQLSDGEWTGIASALSLALAPYAISHDYVILAFPWALTLARATQLRAVRRRLLFFSLLVAASPLPWALEAFAFGRGELLSPLVPAAAAVLLALAIHAGRDEGATQRLPVTE